MPLKLWAKLKLELLRVHFYGVHLKIHPYFISDQLFDDVFSKHGVSHSQELLEKNSHIFYVPQLYELKGLNWQTLS